MNEDVTSKKELEEQHKFEEFEARVQELLSQWRISKRPAHRRINKLLLDLNTEYSFTGAHRNK